MKTFPYDLLYLKKECGGVGLPRLSDAVNVDKLAQLLRAYRRNDEVAEAAKGVVERGLRYQGTHTQADRKACILPVKGKAHWLRSTLEWLTKHNLYLWRGGTSPSKEQLSKPIKDAIPNMSKSTLRRMEKDRLLHLSDIVDETGGYRRWKLPEYARELLDQLPDDPPTGTDVILWPGQYWRTQGMSPTGTRLMNDNAVVEIEYVDKRNNTVIAKCWEPTSRMARVDWYKVKRNIEIPLQELFHRNEATRVDARGKLSHSQRRHFKNDRTLPRPCLESTDESHTAKWLQTAVEFCKAQNTDYLPRIYTDGTYDETKFDLHSVFDTTAVRGHATASVVIVHDRADWKERPALSIRITFGDMIDKRPDYTMEYLALALATQIRQYSKGTGIYSDSQAVVKVIRKRQKHLSKGILVTGLSYKPSTLFSVRG